MNSELYQTTQNTLRKADLERKRIKDDAEKKFIKTVVQVMTDVMKKHLDKEGAAIIKEYANPTVFAPHITEQYREVFQRLLFSLDNIPLFPHAEDSKNDVEMVDDDDSD